MLEFAKVVALIEKPAVVKRILTHLKLWPSEKADRAPPSPAASGGSPTEPHYEPLFDDLPWEEPTFDDAPSPEDPEEGDGAMIEPNAPPDVEPI